MTRDHLVTYRRGVDLIFNALAHPVRRQLLDALAQRGGQTLVELQRAVPLTRFAVMKHLRLLEEAHLVTSERRGREKLHHLNRVPIQQVSDRWISRYTAPFAQALVDLKNHSEGIEKMTNADPKHVYEVFVHAPAQAVWDVLTDDSKTPLYQHFNMASRTDWREGGTIEFLMGDRVVIGGEIVELAPPRRLVTTFHARWSDEVSVDKPSRVTWTIEALNDNVSKVTLVHDDFGGATATSKAVLAGWPETLSRLKTLVETGKSFEIPAAYEPAAA